MILLEIKELVQNALHPVAKALHKGDAFRILAIGFKKGMILKEHQAHLPSKLFVLEGEVVYTQNGTSTRLLAYDEINIPVNETHSVLANENSLCLLTQG